MTHEHANAPALDVTGLLRHVASQLTTAGVSAREARLDAELIVRDVMGWDRARLLIDRDAVLDPPAVERIHALASQRAARAPMAYVRGRVEFWDLEFHVGPGVLIPRPETELIIDAALEWYRDAAPPSLVVDACTGSGCLAVALALEFPSAHLVATDISADALVIARTNAARHGVAGRIDFLEASLLGGATDVDLLVANPPYVAAGDRNGLMPEVRDHEPAVALFGGHDGLEIIRALIAEAIVAVRPGGLMLMEFGYGQADAVVELFGSEWDPPAVYRDLQDIERVVAARRR